MRLTARLLFKPVCRKSGVQESWLWDPSGSVQTATARGVHGSAAAWRSGAEPLISLALQEFPDGTLGLGGPFVEPFKGDMLLMM